MSVILDECEEIYAQHGQQAVFDFVLKNYPSIPWEWCDPCEYISPAEHHTCLVCGSPTREPDDDFGN